MQTAQTLFNMPKNSSRKPIIMYTAGMLVLGKKGTIDRDILQRIYEKRPLLKNVFDEHGSKTLKDFSTHNLSHLPSPNVQRKNELIDALREIIDERLGKEIADGVSDQLQRFYVVSSADHHGSINSSLAVSSNVLFAAGSPELKYLPVFSCASVSLNNEDYPRGIMFHAQEKGGISEQKLSILPSNKHSSLVYGFRSYELTEIEKVEKTLRERIREGQIDAMHAEKIQDVLTSVYRNPDIVSLPSLCAQFTKINLQLWKRYFHGASVPNLIYIELEELASQLLINHHLGSNTPIHKLLFDASMSPVLASLTQAMEPFVRQGQFNTHLFWGITEHSHQRAKLSYTDGSLESEDGSIRISFDPEGIAHALNEKRIMPNLLVIYTLIHLYYGMNCLGGFNQMHYLDAMKKPYNESGIDPLPATGNSTLYAYGNDLFFAGSSPAHGLDLLLYGTNDLWNQTREMIGSMTLEELFGANMHIVRDLLYPAG